MTAREARGRIPRQALIDYSEYLHRGGRHDIGTWWERYKDNYASPAESGAA